ncbi:MAG: hypothetical protein U0795_02970 [Pirellulales bacterium]
MLGAVGRKKLRVSGFGGRRSPKRPGVRAGFTLLELLISLVLTLMLVAALVQVFALLGENVRRTRGLIEMSTQLRVAISQLKKDLASITVDGSAWSTGRANKGYLELLEGAGRDGDLNANGVFFETQEVAPTLIQPAFPTVATGALFGDVDDVLMFTAVSQDEPFRGRVLKKLIDGTSPGYVTIESDTAEIVYWVQRTANGTVALYRRVMLVKPELNQLMAASLSKIDFDNLANWKVFYLQNDLSVRPRPSGKGVIANSLEDLVRRENRFAHDHVIANYPYPIYRELLARDESSLVAGATVLETGPVLIGDLLGFDIKVYDPQAPLQLLAVGANSAGQALSLRPGDAGFDVKTLTAPDASAAGAFVDLGYDSQWKFPTWRGSHFSGPPHRTRPAKQRLAEKTFSTWPEVYEHDGIDQDADGLIDEGRDGIDNDNPAQLGLGVAGVVDDVGEEETAPPYPYPLRGIEITVRILDPSTRQLRQASVAHDFMGG